MCGGGGGERAPSEDALETTPTLWPRAKSGFLLTRNCSFRLRGHYKKATSFTQFFLSSIVKFFESSTEVLLVLGIFELCPNKKEKGL